MYPEWFDLKTNCRICGATQMGKTYLNLDMKQKCIEAFVPFTDIDLPGTAYAATLDRLNYIRPRNPIIAMNVSRPDIHGVPRWNPFSVPKGRRPRAHAARCAQSVIKAWGLQNSDQMPTYERICTMLFTLMAHTGESLNACARILKFHNRHLIEWAIRSVPNEDDKDDWRELLYIRKWSEWNAFFMSTDNRIRRLLRCESIALISGQKDSVSLAEMIDAGAYILVNLAPSDWINLAGSQAFAALLFDAYLDDVMASADRVLKRVLFCDEAQEYVTADSARLLDLGVKTGLRATLTHHSMEQLKERGGPALAASIDVNCKIVCAFGGLPVDEELALSKAVFMHEINTVVEKRRLYGYMQTGFERVHDVQLSTSKGTNWQESETESSQDTWSDGGSSAEGSSEYSSRPDAAPGSGTFSQSGESHQSGGSFGTASTKGAGGMHSETATGVTRLEPIIKREVTQIQDFTLEEKTWLAAEKLHYLEPRNYILKLPNRWEARAVPLQQYVYSPGNLISDGRIVEFNNLLEAAGTPLAEAQQRIDADKASFAERTKQHDDDDDGTAAAAGAEKPSRRKAPAAATPDF